MTPIIIYNGDDPAADWNPKPTDLSPPSVTWYGGYAPCFDEWNALRLSQGQRMGSFTEYMRDIAPMLAQEESGS